MYSTASYFVVDWWKIRQRKWCGNRRWLLLCLFSRDIYIKQHTTKASFSFHWCHSKQALHSKIRHTHKEKICAFKNTQIHEARALVSVAVWPLTFTVVHVNNCGYHSKSSLNLIQKWQKKNAWYHSIKKTLDYEPASVKKIKWQRRGLSMCDVVC